MCLRTKFFEVRQPLLRFEVDIVLHVFGSVFSNFELANSEGYFSWFEQGSKMFFSCCLGIVEGAYPVSRSLTCVFGWFHLSFVKFNIIILSRVIYSFIVLNPINQVLSQYNLSISQDIGFSSQSRFVSRSTFVSRLAFVCNTSPSSRDSRQTLFVGKKCVWGWLYLLQRATQWNPAPGG